MLTFTIIDMYNIYTNFNLIIIIIHGTHVARTLHICLYRQKNASNNNHWWQDSIKLQKEVKSNPKAA